MGALIMAHSDNNGLVLPPRLAPTQVVLIPIYKGDEQLRQITARLDEIAAELRALGVSVKVDDRDNVRSGFKFAEYELKGVPVRLVIGPRDFENGTIEVARRDTLTKEVRPQEGLAEYVKNLLNDIQDNIYQKALKFREEHTVKVDTYDEFKRVLEETPGFVLAHWDGTPETEEQIKNETKATIRNIPVDAPYEEGVDMISGKPSVRRVLFARSY
jgi:prolyl-tRNA synthetase